MYKPGEIIIESADIENRRLKKWFSFSAWNDGKFEKCDSFTELPNDMFPYNLTKQTMVLDTKTMEAVKLDQLKKNYKEAAGVFGFKGVLEPIETKYAVRLDSDAVMLLRAAEEQPGTLSLYSFKYNEETKLLEPHGVGCYSAKMLTIKAMETLSL